MNRALGWALAFYATAVILGTVLRVSELGVGLPFDWGHGVHAHSHTLYFGWAGLTCVVIAFDAAGASTAWRRAITLGLITLAIATFVAFLHSGYGPPGIIVSAAALPVWLAVVVIWWRAARVRTGPVVAHLRVAMVYVVLALLGGGARAVLKAAGNGDVQLAALAVFSFLHNFAAFFLFAVIAALLATLERHGVPARGPWARRALMLAAASAWLTFPLGVHGGTGAWGLDLVTRAAALAFTSAKIIWVMTLWRAAAPLATPLRRAFRAVTGALAGVALMDLVGIGGFTGAAVALRVPVIAYLHLLLLGVISLALLIWIGERWRVPVGRVAALHALGVATMLTGLGVRSLAVLGVVSPAGALRLAPVLTLAGSVLVVVAVLDFAVSALRCRRRMTASAPTTRSG